MLAGRLDDGVAGVGHGGVTQWRRLGQHQGDDLDDAMRQEDLVSWTSILILLFSFSTVCLLFRGVVVEERASSGRRAPRRRRPQRGQPLLRSPKRSDIVNKEDIKMANRVPAAPSKKVFSGCEMGVWVTREKEVLRGQNQL